MFKIIIEMIIFNHPNYKYLLLLSFLLLNQRTESAMIAVAMVKDMLYSQNKDVSGPGKHRAILERLDIPDTVKANLTVNLKPYLQAIEVSGYEKYKVRKLMLVGNTGMKR